MQRRRRFKQHVTLQDRLALWAKQIIEQANKLPPGPDRNALLKKAKQADVAARLDNWASSPSLRTST